MRRFASLDNILYCSNVFMNRLNLNHMNLGDHPVCSIPGNPGTYEKEGQAKILPTHQVYLGAQEDLGAIFSMGLSPVG